MYIPSDIGVFDNDGVVIFAHGYVSDFTVCRKIRKCRLCWPGVIQNSNALEDIHVKCDKNRQTDH